MKDLNRLAIVSVDKLKDCSEPFAKELLTLWHNRKLRGEAIIYEKSDRILGFILLEHKEGEIVNRGLYVRENFRGYGIGQSMLTYLHKTYCKSHMIWTNITKGSEGIYHKFNYRVLGERKEFGQFIAYYPESKITESKIQQLKNKVDGE
ncbi:MAG TPA: GNAT family N-acetyltransferase [Candidatus Absconditabacterales bacterium]|nr:GNAT family N-acetyltransferase [Candidatus Absconditabacterales bacterium]